MTQLIFWAIQKKEGGALLPLPPVRGGMIKGFSHPSVRDGGIPRLFKSRESAVAALRAYCMGKWCRPDYESPPELINQSSRPRSDYQVIPVQLRYDD